MQKLYWCFLAVDVGHVTVDTYPTVIKSIEKHKNLKGENWDWHLVSNTPLPIWCSEKATHSFVVLCDSELMANEMELMPDDLLHQMLEVVKSYHPIIRDNVFRDLSEVVAHLEEHMDCC